MFYLYFKILLFKHEKEPTHEITTSLYKNCISTLDTRERMFYYIYKLSYTQIVEKREILRYNIVQ